MVEFIVVVTTTRVQRYHVRAVSGQDAEHRYLEHGIRLAPASVFKSIDVQRKKDILSATVLPQSNKAD